MNIKSFLKKEGWVYLLLLIVLIGIGLFIYFFVFFQKNEEVREESEELSEEVKLDKTPPSTAIISPENKSWHNTDFEVTIYDSDLGSGLISFLPGERGCRYIIEDLGTKNAIGDYRECDPVKVLVPVGKEKTCSSSYQKENPSQGKCKVSIKAFDRAGNESGWKSRIFNIDLIPPKINQATIVFLDEGVLDLRIISDQNLELNQNYLFKSTASDNSKITGCWFYINGEPIKTPPEIEPIPCEDENQCDVFLNYAFGREDTFSVRFGCTDRAGNVSFGKPINVEVTTNHPPKISSCRVTPIQGNIETEFKLDVAAIDPDEDQLFYFWDFGDGNSSAEKTPNHYYSISGTYEPKVIVFDNRGGEAECSTAWVTIVEK